MTPFLLALAAVTAIGGGGWAWWVRDDFGWRSITVAITTCAFLVGALISVTQHQEDTCHRNGGKMVETGRIIPLTTYIQSGQTMIPITTYVNETACSV